MCWSANGSLATWIAGMSIALASNRQYDPALWNFMVLFTQIQLIEYFLWKDLRVPKLNAIWSKVGLTVILLEPLAAILLIKNANLRQKAILAYGVWIAAVLLTQKFDFTTVVGGNGHLKWNWLIPSFWWAVPWFIFLFGAIWVSGNPRVFWFAVATWLISSYFYLRYKTIASMWCWIAISMWLIYFIASRK